MFLADDLGYPLVVHNPVLERTTLFFQKKESDILATIGFKIPLLHFFRYDIHCPDSCVYVMALSILVPKRSAPASPVGLGRYSIVIFQYRLTLCSRHTPYHPTVFVCHSKMELSNSAYPIHFFGYCPVRYALSVSF